MAEGFTPNQDYYKSIGVDQSATKDQIKRKIHSLAKQFHPDKTHTTATEDLMKQLNKIKSVLLDDVEKRIYDEELVCKLETYVPLFMKVNRATLLLPPAPPHSREFISLFNASKKKFAKIPKPKYDAIWEQFDRQLYTLSTEISAKEPRASIHRKLLKSSSEYDKINNAAERYSAAVDHDFGDFETIRSILKRIHSSPIHRVGDREGEIIPILDMYGTPTSDLHTLLSLFTTVPKSITKENMLRMISKFIPVTAIQAPLTKTPGSANCTNCKSKPRRYTKKTSQCNWCSRNFCSKCPLGIYRFPRIGLCSCILCSECVEDLTRADAEDWAEASKSFLATPDDRSIVASLGCASMAIALGVDSSELLRSISKELHDRGLHELAYNIIAMAISAADGKATNKQTMKMHHFASSILKRLAEDLQKPWKERWSFALASKESYLIATSMITESDIEVVGNRKQVTRMLEEKTEEHKTTITRYTRHLEILWGERNILGMLYYLIEMSVESRDCATVVGEDASLIAFQEFLQNKEPYLASMIPDDRHAVLFLRGILKLKEEKFISAIADFESAAWSSSHLNIPKEVILSPYLYLLSEQNSSLYSYAALKSVLQSGSKTLFFTPLTNEIPPDKSLKLLFPTKEEELTPPFKANWPSLSVVEHNTRCHEKYEQAVLKLHDEKKWTTMKVAWAYIDAIPGCEHPAEVMVCHLHAAMWMAKLLNPKSKLEPHTLFGLKCVIMKLIQKAHVISYICLNPGMELYALRLVFGIVRKLTLMPNSQLVLTDDDAAYLQEIFKRLIKTSKLFPFWEPPSVSVSEAVMLNIVTRNLFSSFVLELQEVSPEHRPLTCLELKYQLYECNLRGFLSLANSNDTRSRAMEELLKSQNWTWSDVVRTMSSPLSPRDANGWLIQSPHLGIPQDYSEITGLVIDTDPDHPSIKLMVVKADPRKGRTGLFSQEDIDMMFQLDATEFPLYFSLDPPEHDLSKRFHPFQQWRYATEKLKDSKVLSTMFITDYLMKSFTVGSDVSAQPPFLQRPCKEGLTKDLPPHLQDAIRSIEDRGHTYSQSTHRFWIEAKEMKYSCQQTGSKIEFLFGEMEMMVKSHSLLRHTDGELADTDEEDDPDSLHAKFARDMTDNYTELSQHFPEFARLRQLSKLQTATRMLHSVLQNMEESSKGIGISIPKELLQKIQEDVRKQHRTNVSAALNELEQQVGTWPTAQNQLLIQSKVDEIKREIQSEMDREEQRLYSTYGYNITIDDSDARQLLRHTESMVISAFEKKDAAVLTQVTQALKESLQINQDHQLKEYVRDWLSNNTQTRYSLATHRTSEIPRERLLQYICSHLPIPTHDDVYKSVLNHECQKYQAVSNIVNRFKSRQLHGPTSCKWVPAAISSHMHSISYGGVAFIPKLTALRDGERIQNTTTVTLICIASPPVHAKPIYLSVYSAPKGNAVPVSITSSSNSGSTNSGNGSSGKSSSSRNNAKSGGDSDDGSCSSGDSTRFQREATAAANNEERYMERDQDKRSQSKFAWEGIKTIAIVLPANADIQMKENISALLNDTLNQLQHSLQGGGRGDGKGGEPSNHRYITLCIGELQKYFQDPSIMIEKLISHLLLPEVTVKPKSFNRSDVISGIYVLRNKRNGEIYIGMSNNLWRRICQHLRDVEKGEKTVGNAFEAVDNLEFCILDLPASFDKDDRRCCEQFVMNVARECGYTLINKREAMNSKDFEQRFKDHIEPLIVY